METEKLFLIKGIKKKKEKKRKEKAPPKARNKTLKHISELLNSVLLNL